MSWTLAGAILAAGTTSRVNESYAGLIGSLWTPLRDTPLLRRRALYQAALFAASRGSLSPEWRERWRHRPRADWQIEA